jgi:hypothetical protein
VGCMRFSTKSKNAYIPLQSGWRHTTSEQAVAYLRKILVAKPHKQKRKTFTYTV